MPKIQSNKNKQVKTLKSTRKNEGADRREKQETLSFLSFHS